MSARHNWWTRDGQTFTCHRVGCTAERKRVGKTSYRYRSTAAGEWWETKPQACVTPTASPSPAAPALGDLGTIAGEDDGP